MFTDRFEIQKKDYSYSAQVNFAECREKVKIDPNATVCVDFMKEEQEKKAVKAAESPHTVAQSTQQDSAKPTLSPRETSEIALEADDTVILCQTAQKTARHATRARKEYLTLQMRGYFRQ